jgi:hypothetical protein
VSNALPPSAYIHLAACQPLKKCDVRRLRRSLAHRVRVARACLLSSTSRWWPANGCLHSLPLKSTQSTSHGTPWCAARFEQLSDASVITTSAEVPVQGTRLRKSFATLLDGMLDARQPPGLMQSGLMPY